MKTNLTVSMVSITPERAENFLRFNVKNRKVSDRVIIFLTKQMEDGLFLENGEAIIFDKNGDLKDGQHRLIAITKSKKTYNIPIVRGVEPIAMATYDTGKSRTAADVLNLNGFKYSVNVASFISSINKVVLNKSKANSTRGLSSKKALTNQQILVYCTENYDWIKDIVSTSAMLTQKINPKVLTTTQVSLLAYIIGGETPRKEVYDFIRQLLGITRQEETATSYIYGKLYNSKINKDPLNFYWILGMSLKAWNYYSDGNPSIKYFKFNVEQELPKVNKTFLN